MPECHPFNYLKKSILHYFTYLTTESIPVKCYKNWLFIFFSQDRNIFGKKTQQKYGYIIYLKKVRDQIII